MKYLDSLYNKDFHWNILIQSFVVFLWRCFAKQIHLDGHAGDILEQWCLYGGIKTDSLALGDNGVNQTELLRSFLLCSLLRLVSNIGQKFPYPLSF